MALGVMNGLDFQKISLTRVFHEGAALYALQDFSGIRVDSTVIETTFLNMPFIIHIY